MLLLVLLMLLILFFFIQLFLHLFHPDIYLLMIVMRLLLYLIYLTYLMPFLKTNMHKLLTCVLKFHFLKFCLGQL